MKKFYSRREVVGGAAAAVGALAFPTVDAAQQKKSGPESIWFGKTNGYDIDWRSDRLDVLSADKGTLVLSFGAVAERDWQHVRELAGDTPGSMDRTYAVRSAIGPWLSVEEGAYCDCGGAHPSEVRNVLAFDLRKGGQNAGSLARLDDIFASKYILSAMLENPLIRSAIGDSGGSKPDTLETLIENINMQTVNVDECGFQFRRSFLSNFAFDRVDSDVVTVVLTLPAAYELCRGQTTGIELSLSLQNTVVDSKTLYYALEDARKSERGLLASRADAIANGRVAAFTFKK